MTAKDKAIDLLNDMAFICRDNGNYPGVAKQCALLTINEILNISAKYTGKDYEFYLDVKTEIEKLIL